MFSVRQYIPFVALAFGFILTTVWVALMSWFPVHFILVSAFKMLSDLDL
jgi:hypothetical protein